MLILHQPRPLPIRDDSIFGVAISPDGTRLASAGGFVNGKDARGEIRLWDLMQGSLITILHTCRNFARCVAFSPDGRFVAAGCGDRTVRLWEVATQSPAGVFKGHTRVPVCLAFSPDGKLLASGSADQQGQHGHGELIVRTMPFGVEQWRHAEPQGIWAVAFSPIAPELAFGSRSVGLVKTTGGDTTTMLPSLKAYVRSLSYSPDGRTLAAICDRGIALLDAPQREVRTMIREKTQRNWALAFTADGSTLVSGHGDGLVRTWDTGGAGKGTFEWGFDNVRGVTCAPDGMKAAACGTGKVNLIVWDTQ